MERIRPGFFRGSCELQVVTRKVTFAWICFSGDSLWLPTMGIHHHEKPPLPRLFLLEVFPGIELPANPMTMGFLRGPPGVQGDPDHLPYSFLWFRKVPLQFPLTLPQIHVWNRPWVLFFSGLKRRTKSCGPSLLWAHLAGGDVACSWRVSLVSTAGRIHPSRTRRPAGKLWEDSHVVCCPITGLIASPWN